MHIADGEEEYLEQGKIRSILERYCAFMPVEIYLDIVGKEEEHHHDGCDCDDCKEEKDSTPKPINDTSPLWLKQPSECTEEEYKAFYSKVFADYREPLFHIHINAEYPLNFKGILYFPRLNAEYDSFEGQVKLYYNQVFVADNIKEVIPEYMLMLKGVLDCPELPLNVSRSYLQNNGYVSKISSHIVKKICDKLNGLFNTDREGYEKMWQDIKIFVEYSAMRDRKFYDRVKNSILLPLSDGSYKTVDEYLEGAKETNEGIVYYSTDKLTQAQYIAMLKKQGINVVIFDKLIETQLINLLESDKNIKFMRVDSSIADSLKGDGKEFKNDSLAELFKKVSGNETLEVKFESLKDEKVPALLTVSEQSRRFEDMMKMYRMSGGEDDGSYKAPIESTLILNSSSALIRKMAESKSGDELESAAKQIYRLALLSHRQLTADELESFLYDSFDMLEKNF